MEYSLIVDSGGQAFLRTDTANYYLGDADAVAQIENWHPNQIAKWERGKKAFPLALVPRVETVVARLEKKFWKYARPNIWDFTGKTERAIAEGIARLTERGVTAIAFKSTKDNVVKIHHDGAWRNCCLLSPDDMARCIEGHNWTDGTERRLRVLLQEWREGKRWT